MTEAIVALLTAPFVIFLLVIAVVAIFADWAMTPKEPDYMKPFNDRKKEN